MESSPQSSFGTLLRYFRDRARLSQEELAESAKLSWRTISDLERGKVKAPHRETVKMLADALNLTDQERVQFISVSRLGSFSPATTASVGLVETSQVTVEVSPQTRFLNVPPRNPYFTGREGMLEQLHRRLTSANQTVSTQAISGLGGMGKTQTALEYAYRYQRDYQFILWMVAETRDVLIGSVLALAHQLGLPEQDAQEQERIVSALQRWLEEQTGWLLILDNVEDLQLGQSILPARGHGHVLLTTRSQAVGSLGRPLALDVLTPEEGALLLLRRAKFLDLGGALNDATTLWPEAQELAEKLGGLPLALDQGGAYIEETRCGLAGYLEQYQPHYAELLRRRGRLASGHPDSVMVTFTLAFNQVKEINPAAGDLLRCCAFLYPENIPEDLFTKGAPDLTPPLRRAVADPLRWNDALEVLHRYSLVDRQPETKTLSLHRLVQLVLREDLGKTAARRWEERVVRMLSHAFPLVEFSTWERCQHLLPHALATVPLIETSSLVPVEATQMLNQAGYYLYERGQYAEALPLVELALALSQQSLDPSHPNTATSLNNLALLYRTQGRYTEAIPLMQQAVTIREQVYGPNHLLVATSLNNLAALYRAQKQYTKALPLAQRALAIREQVLGPAHPEVATSLNNLAALYRAQKQYTEALPLAQRALAISQEALGATHPNVATSLNNLVLIYQAQGQYAEALPLAQRALAIREQALGATHPNVATSLNNLAELYQAQSEYDEAVLCYERALAIREQALGPTHPNTVTCLENLSRLLLEMGRVDQAQALHKRVQAIHAASS